MIKNIIPAALLLVAVSGCDKNLLEENKNWASFPNNANVKFINAFTGLNPSAASPVAGPSVDVLINDTKVSAAPIGYTALFPAVSGQYSNIPAGSVNIKAVINRVAPATPQPGDVLVNGNFSLVAGNYYSAFIVDTMPLPAGANPNIAIVQDDATRAQVGSFKMRFAHMIPTTDTLEIYSKNRQSVVITNVTYKTVSPFVELPLQSINDTLQLRKKGTTTVLTEQRPFFPTSERLYTFFCRGLYTVTSGTRARTLTVYTNQ